MVKLPIYNESGQKQSEMEVNTSLLGEKPNVELIKQAIVMYQANKRQGTHKTLTRAEVAGSMKKLWKQKGTGRARVGTAKSPVFVGGGRAFASIPREYRKTMPKKAREAALRSALLSKILDNEIVVVDGVSFDKAQTKRASNLIKNLKLVGSVVYAAASSSKELQLSFRNLEKARLTNVGDLNTLDVMNCKRLLIDKAALEQFLKAGE